MAAKLTHPHLAFAFGILGNIVSFLVYLAPLPTFYRIYKKKSTQGFQCIPYSVALFSAMLYLYYAFLKKHSLLIIISNCIGSGIETTYLIIFIIYATRQAKINTVKMLILFNFLTLGVIITLTIFLSHEKRRVSIVGSICGGFSVMVFAAPLSIMRQVIKTKSVEFMPITLSLFLTICAVIWFFYGFLIEDYFIATPNILGFIFGICQMILYAMYKKSSKEEVVSRLNFEEMSSVVIDLATIEKQLINLEIDQKILETGQIIAVGDEIRPVITTTIHEPNVTNVV